MSLVFSSIPLGNTITRLPMHASFSFHHSNLQLAYTIQAWILKLVPCKQIYEMHIQMQHISHELAPPTCVLKILIDPFPLSYLSSYIKFSFLLSFHHLSTLIYLLSFSPCTNIFVISPPITYIFVSLPLCHQ